MNGPWEVSARDVIVTMQGGDGSAFTDLVDRLIRSECFSNGIAETSLYTNMRTNLPDGGIDTLLEDSIQSSVTGYFNTPTIWQYKATSFTNVNVKDEVENNCVIERIMAGYGYILCVCDDNPALKVKDIESDIDRLLTSYYPRAKPSIVLTASRLASWISKFPAIVVSCFKPQLMGFWDMETWHSSITDVTRQYVPVEKWEHIENALLSHIDWKQIPPSSVFELLGDAGAGKTRLVYEVLNRSIQQSSVAIYSDNEEQVEKLAAHISGKKDLNALIIADECSLKYRLRIKRKADHARERIRIIAIDNFEYKESFNAKPPWLDRADLETVLKILETNYPDVPEERRRYYADICQSWIRSAADLCRSDKDISSVNTISAIMSDPYDLFISRLRDDSERRYIAALSLFRKIGFRGEKEHEFGDFCSVFEFDKNDVLIKFRKVKDQPGFCAIGGKYFYVTPKIIAFAAFRYAFTTWIKDNKESFMLKIPDGLLQVFLERLQELPENEEVKSILDFFQEWGRSLKPSDLGDIDTVLRLVPLTESDPEFYLPTIEKLIEEAPQDGLRANFNFINTCERGWKARRHLVWLFERLSGFAEYFEVVERCLRKLALAESEPGISNNATGIYRQIFQIGLSGTSIPFEERLKILETIVEKGDDATIGLAFPAIGSSLKGEYTRSGVSKIIGGRLAPPEWKPDDDKQFIEAYKSSIEFLESRVNKFPDAVFRVVLENLRSILNYRMLEPIRNLYNTAELTESVVSKTLETGEEFLHYDCKPGRADSKYCQAVEKWLESLLPDTFHWRLVKAVGVEPWHYDMIKGKDEWIDSLKDIAQRLVSEDGLFDQEAVWLFSEEAKSSLELGGAIAYHDSSLAYFEKIVHLSTDRRSYRMAKGYVSGILKYHKDSIEDLNLRIDEVQENDAEAAFEIFLIGAEKTRTVERSIELVKTDKLSALSFSNFVYGGLIQRISITNFTQIVKLLFKSRPKESSKSLSVIIQLSYFRLRIEERPPELHEAIEDEALSLIWEVLDQAVGQELVRTYEWNSLILSLYQYDHQREEQLKNLLKKASTDKDIHWREESKEVLGKLVENHPNIVMDVVGSVMLDDAKWQYIYMGKFRPLISKLPFEIVKSWLTTAGAKGAAQFVRHAPSPMLDGNGKPLVPEITEFILTEFEDNERVFHEFCAGVGNFKMYVGNIAEQHEKEAEVATRFLSHPLKRIREWADIERKSSLAQAEEERIRREEDEIP